MTDGWVDDRKRKRGEVAEQMSQEWMDEKKTDHHREVEFKI